MGMPLKQERFVAEYLIDLNATQGAIRAGYSKRTARQIASELLSKPVIQRVIERKCKEAEARLELTRDDVIRGLLAAYKEAKKKGNPLAMIAAMREIGRMLGYYSSARGSRQIEQVSRGSASIGMELKSDRELMAMCQGSGGGH
ncbi:MAG: terminase small subunit [Gammaproteobacteria bacterium]|nr:terminase small subunit [Gammaproteobacteria bacterium]